MAISQLESPVFRSVLANGEANDSGYVYVYTVGGTYSSSADQITVWTDKDRTVAHSQPIQLSSSGEKEIWFDGTVELRIEDSATTLIDTIIGVQSSPTIAISGEFNLVTNGSFEVDSDSDGEPDNWTLSPEINATISIDSSSGNQTHGANSLHFDATGGTTGGGVAVTDTFSVEEGNGLTVSWGFKQSGAATGTYKVEVLYYDYADNYVGADTVWTSTTSAPTTWTQYSNTDAAPVVDTGATKAKLRLTGLANGGTDETGECWFDNVSCVDPLGLVTLTGTQTLTNKTLTSPVLDTGVSGSALETTITDTDTKIPTSGAVLDRVGGLNTVVLDIGDWDMDATQNLPVTHGLDASKIRGVNVLIRNDLATLSYAITGNTFASKDGYYYVSSTAIVLIRSASGAFDTIDFDSTSYNRGWVTIQYVD